MQFNRNENLCVGEIVLSTSIFWSVVENSTMMHMDGRLSLSADLQSHCILANINEQLCCLL